jgi:hypothetical protein
MHYLQFDTQKWMPPAIILNTVERSDDLSNKKENLWLVKVV